mgnify:CR=1 FL=1
MIKAFRIITLLEGFSLLVLLFLAMPLKYIWNLPQMVQVVGMAHGILFLLFAVMALMVFYELKWSIKTFGIVMFASLIPFGYIYIDKKYLNDFKLPYEFTYTMDYPLYIEHINLVLAQINSEKSCKIFSKSSINKSL